MRIDLTLRHGGASHDLRVEAEDAVALRAVRAAVAHLCGVPPDVPAWVDGVALDADGAWSAAGLRTGCVLDTSSPPTGRAVPAALTLDLVGGPHAGRRIPLDRGRLVLGRAAECDVVLDDPDTSRRHAAVTVAAGGVRLSDLGSTNGIAIGGVAVPPSGAVLGTGDVARVGATLLSVSAGSEPPAARRPGAGATVGVVRSPRRWDTVGGATVQLPQPPRHVRPRSVQWIAALVPAVFGAAVAWFTGAAEFLLFALLSPVMMLATSLGDRVSWRTARRRSAAEYAALRAGAERERAAALCAEVGVRRRLAQDPVAVAETAGVPTRRLWERRRADDDLLTVRLGTAAVPATTRVRDATADRCAGELSDVPVCVDLRAGPVGLSGPDATVVGVARWLIAQAATQCSPADLEIVLVTDADHAGRWTWLRWLPHCRTHPVLDPTAGARLVEELAARAPDPAHGGAGHGSARWTLLLVDGAGPAAVPGLDAVLATGSGCAVTAVFLARLTSALPASCAHLVQTSDDTGSRLRLTEPGETHDGVLADLVASEWAENLARSLAPLVDAGAGGDDSLPPVCPLGQLHDLRDVDALVRGWASATGGARALIGTAADGHCLLDLVADGPHMLVAGTTGAGKSEFLQALVAGLAVAQSPRELTVLLVDYKGGAAFGLCSRLPHAAGLVTDLDPYLTERALRSLRSELRRRESLLAAAGAADLAQYRASGTGPTIARLVIVVDEFAALVEELPQFVDGLVAIAQRGRSLGVHLVLATQRPGTAVSPEIRANTAIRVALRVTDRAESTDVIDGPVAATIPRTSPGRAYLRRGASLTPVQSAWPGARSVADDDATVRLTRLDAWRRPIRPPGVDVGRTDLDTLVSTIGAAAQRAGIGRAVAPWSAPLPDVLDPARLPRPEEPDLVVFATADLPDEQRQAAVALDIARGDSLLVVGTARSGRTTALASIAIAAANAFGPDDLQLYVIDAAGHLRETLRRLPQLMTALDRDEPTMVLRLLDLLTADCSACERDADPAGDGRARPARLLLVDGWEAVAAALDDNDTLHALESMSALLRSGPSARLSVVLGGDRATLTPRFSGSFAERVALRLADRADYALLGVHARDVPATLPPGRGVRASDAAVVQVGLPPEVNVPAARAPDRPTDRTDAREIRLTPLPASVRLDDIAGGGDGSGAGTTAVVGIAGDAARPLALDLFEGPARLLVAGPPRSGRTTVLRLLHRQLVSAGVGVLVVAGARSPLAEAARAAGTTVLDPRCAAGAVPPVPPVPPVPTVVLVDDCEALLDTELEDALMRWTRQHETPLAFVVAGCSDDLATTYRGLAPEIRRARRGILLRPGPIDGELLGLRLPRRAHHGPPGRGIVIGDPQWHPAFSAGTALPLQVALP